MSNEHEPTDAEGVTTDGHPSVSGEETTTGNDLDRLFEVLADGRRRRVLTYLDDAADDVVAFSELVEHVVADSTEESSDERERVAVSLHHSHLPKLADAGVVEYDVRSETVRYRDDRMVSDWIELAQSQETNVPT